MPRKSLDLRGHLMPSQLASAIAVSYDRWNSAQSRIQKQWSELRDYVFATDTTTTTNASLPWKNKTTRPKLCQIRDNLHANYMAALFPNDNWFKWKAADQASAEKEKAHAIKAYMQSKLKDSRFKEIVSRLVYDYIDYGNCFADVEYVNEEYLLPDGTYQTEYTGPRLVRISPYDIKFDITASSFEGAPKIMRELLSFGDIERLTKTDPVWMAFDASQIRKIQENRAYVTGFKESEIHKSQGFVADGFSSISHYYNSGLVEVLTFYGDWYDTFEAKLYSNCVITVVDRCYIMRNEPIKSWFGKASTQHCGWRLRPDNLMAMGPLDNLVGMQYRIDHLENLKADVFDMIAHPITAVKGYVEDFVYGPGERIYMDADASVDHMRPDTTALNANFDIGQLQVEMEEMAGAPKQAMGIRTPGEKTAFEVQTLENASGRMFQSKISYFEEHFLEPLLNNLLEISRRNLNGADLIGVLDDDVGVVEFLSITKKDLTAKGKLVPLGARHFAAQAQLIQNLTALSGTGLYQDPAIQVHFSGFQIAKLIEENLGLEEYGVVAKNVRIDEQTETQNLMSSASEQTQVNAMTPLEEIPDDQLPAAEEDPTAEESGEATF